MVFRNVHLFLPLCNIRTSGLIAVNLREEDELISVRLTDGQRRSLSEQKMDC